MKNKAFKNKGFSLVEVIVAVAVMSIVVAGAFQLIVSGSKMYTKTSTSVDVQTEAQLLENQLNNMIVDAERGVYASAEPGTDSAGFTADSYVKVFNTANAYYIAWDSTEEKVYFIVKKVVDGSVEALTDTEKNITNWSLMGENVTGFSPNTSHVSDNQRLVVIELEVSKRDVHYSTVQNISLRNNVLESNDLADIYDGEEVEGEVTITDVTVSPKVTSLNRGGTQSFSAVVTAAGSVAPSQNVVWSVSGQSSADTKVSSSGQLTIGMDEGASVINVRATAEGTSIYDTATVIIPQVTGVTVTSSNMTPAAGGTAIFTAEVSGSNLDIAARAVTWSVEAPGYNDKVAITQEGVLYIDASVPADTQVTVKGTVAVTVGTEHVVFDTCTVSVSNAVATGFVISSEKTTLNRGGSLTMHAVLDGMDLTSGGGNVYWTIEDDAGLGDKISISTAGVLTAARDISYAGTYTITVKASTGSALAGQSYETTASIQIPAVNIVFESNAAFVVKGQTVRFPYTVYGLENASRDVSVSSSPAISGSGTFMYCNDTELVVAIGNTNRSMTKVTLSLMNNTNVTGSVVIYIKDESNVAGMSVYAPAPEDTEIFPKEDQFVRVDGTDRSNVVSLIIGNQTYSYWIQYNGNNQIYHLLIGQTEYIYQIDKKRWERV